MNAWLNTVIGKAGTAGLLGFAGLSVLVIAYNIDFKAPKIKLTGTSAQNNLEELQDELLPVEYNRSPLTQTETSGSDFQAKPKPFEGRNKVHVEEELVQ